MKENFMIEISNIIFSNQKKKRKYFHITDFTDLFDVYSCVSDSESRNK